MKPTQPALPDAAIAALRDGRVIDAIKIVREQTGLGLADAKTAVDAHVTGSTTQHVASETASIPLPAIAMLAAGNLIGAIKATRAGTSPQSGSDSRQRLRSSAARSSGSPSPSAQFWSRCTLVWRFAPEATRRPRVGERLVFFQPGCCSMRVTMDCHVAATHKDVQAPRAHGDGMDAGGRATQEQLPDAQERPLLSMNRAEYRRSDQAPQGRSRQPLWRRGDVGSAPCGA